MGATLGGLGDSLNSGFNKATSSLSGGAAPDQAAITQGISQDQINNGYNGAQQGLNSQQQLLSALQRQNGITNQSSVFNQGQALANALQGGVATQQGAVGQQQALNQALAGAGGAQNLAGAYGQSQALASQLAGANAVGTQQQAIQAQQGLANQYQNIANGQGPNPAQAMLNQQTGQNVAQQAALMAGQRGAGANVGLLARQAAQQGAGIQQQAVGQGATMQAQQSLNALGQVGGAQNAAAAIAGQQLGAQQAQQANLAQQAAQQVGLQQQGIGQQAGMGAQQVAQQQMQQAQLAQQAATQSGQQINATTQLSQAQQNEQQQLLGALGAQNQANVSSQASVNAANAGLKQTAMQGQQGLLGGVLNGAGAAIGGLAKGGQVERMADGGATGAMPVTQPQSSFGQFLQGWGSGANPQGQPAQGIMGSMGTETKGAEALNNGAANIGKGISKRAKQAPANEVSATNSADLAGPDTVSTPDIMTAARGGLANSGGHVTAKNPAEKAIKSGDSYTNDKIPAMLSEGEIVIPRHITMGDDPVGAAARFVEETLSKRGNPKKRNFPDGGEVTAEQPEKTDDQEPAPAPQPDAGAPQSFSSVPAPLPQQAAPQTGDADVNVVAQTPPTYGLVKNKLMQDHISYMNDLATNQIKPETYSSLFAKKDTLGKIGTLFGLMVSGAGSGLAHQSNALMDMMNKQIQNDFESQKANRENAKNWVSMQYAHDLQKAQEAGAYQDIIGKKQKNLIEAAGAKSLLEKTPGGANYLENLSKQQHQIMNDASAEAKIYATVPSNLAQLAPNNPQAQAVIQNQIAPAVDAKISQIHETAAQKAAAAAAQAPRQTGGANNVVDSDLRRKLEMEGENTKRASGYVDTTSGIDPEDKGKLDSEIAETAKTRNARDLFANEYNRIAGMKRAGQLPGLEATAGVTSGLLSKIPLAGESLSSAAISGGSSAKDIFQKDRERQIAHLTSTFTGAPFNMSGADAQHQAETMMPNWTDDEKQKEQLFKDNMAWFKSRENHGTLDKYEKIADPDNPKRRLVKTFEETQPKYKPVIAEERKAEQKQMESRNKQSQNWDPFGAGKGKK